MWVGSKNGEFEKSKVASDHTLFTMVLYYRTKKSSEVMSTGQCIYSITPLNMRTLRYYGQRTLVSCTISRFSLKNRDSAAYNLRLPEWWLNI